ncbi:hypothetical protein QS306_05135 [Paraburkholderia bonniea]|uniref:hypothetical protein n=1 Tax=Paraburkholderia bonniea TaxID=2152891 RepID=UPI001FE6F04B|nr:hypothetical protein [Paraburkholderia bonniea]WJF91038.1 hypothetical protein QS306_05135 [Paraburkholderia bonniea]WJF94352.1 hypothetical protein QS308_05140 [Paraburkholderia bonniea]
MPLTFEIHWRSFSVTVWPGTWLSVALACGALSGGLHAQETSAIEAASTVLLSHADLAPTPFVMPAPSALLVRGMPEAAHSSADANAAPADPAPAAESTGLIAAVLNLTPGTTSTGAALDDQMLSAQRGGAVGQLMIAATPQLMRSNSTSTSNSITLWDEMAPPMPLPVPVDAATRSTQSNLTSYQRK